MPTKPLTIAAVLVGGFLVATNPVVVHAGQQITGQQIKNGSVTGIDIKDRSLGAVDLKKGVVPRVLFATVDETGKVLHSSGGVTAKILGPATDPEVRVNFPSKVTGCSPTATLGINSNNGITYGESVSAFLPQDGSPGTATHAVDLIFYSAGPGTFVTSGFSLVVACPPVKK